MPVATPHLLKASDPQWPHAGALANSASIRATTSPAENQGVALHRRQRSEIGEQRPEILGLHDHLPPSESGGDHAPTLSQNRAELSAPANHLVGATESQQIHWTQLSSALTLST